MRELSEARIAVNTADEPTDEQRAALVAADRALAAALESDGDGDGDPSLATTDGSAAEDDERAELRARASVGRMIQSGGRDGAEAEVSAAYDLPAGRIPLQLIWPDAGEEDRAVSTTGTQTTNQQPIAPGIFLNPLMEALGIRSPTVPAGIGAYPFIKTSGKAGAALPGETDANNAAAAAISVATVWPARITGTIEWAMEDAAILQGLEAALRRNIREVLDDTINGQVLTGTGNQSVDRKATPDAAGLKGLLTQYPATASTAKPVDTVAQIISKLTGLVDGTYAENYGDIRLFSSTRALGFLKGVIRDTGSGIDMLQWLESTFAASRFSGRIAGVAADVGKAGYDPVLAHRTARGTGALAPIWQGIEAITDEITGAAKGQTSVTLRMLMGGVLVTRSDSYKTATLNTVIGS